MNFDMAAKGTNRNFLEIFFMSALEKEWSSKVTTEERLAGYLQMIA